MSGRTLRLIRKSTGECVPGRLHADLRMQDLMLIERSWAPERARLMAALLRQEVARDQWPESLHWDWSRKAHELQLLQASCVGIVCDEEWQGAMLTKTVGYGSMVEGPDKGKPVIYVDFVESAPWNWDLKAIGRSPRFKGIGSLLIRESIEQSLREGFHGRVGLHALPQAEVFYDSVCGMTRLDAHHDRQGLVYFEFTRQQAVRFL
ncbi:MAG: GNAT family N-acetyltransferase [Phycisphaerales bacterium]